MTTSYTGREPGNLRVLPVPMTADHYRARLAEVVAEFDARSAASRSSRTGPYPKALLYAELAGALAEAARGYLDATGGAP